MDKKETVITRSTTRRKKIDDLPAFPKLDVWLSKKVRSDVEVKPNNKNTSNLSSKSLVETCDQNCVSNSSKKTRQAPSNQTNPDSILSRRTRHCKGQSPINQTKLDTFLKTRSTKQKLIRSESSDSCDLPIFKNPKSSNKSRKKSNSKYGKVLPTIEEILKDQRDLEEYRQQLENFQPLDDSTLELPFTIKGLDRVVANPVENLDCKQVSDQELNELFKSNLNYLSEIMHGKVKHARHNKFYHIKRNSLSVTTEDLTYNTSMIVFTYNQIEQLLTLLKSHFDPDNTKTQYFFQVLLPELCLQIFMKTHKMNRPEALQYLDKRPILPED